MSVADAGLPFALAFRTLVDLVRGHADQRGNHLRQRQLTAFASADIRRNRHVAGWSLRASRTGSRRSSAAMVDRSRPAELRDALVPLDMNMGGPPPSEE